MLKLFFVYWANRLLKLNLLFLFNVVSRKMYLIHVACMCGSPISIGQLCFSLTCPENTGRGGALFPLELVHMETVANSGGGCSQLAQVGSISEIQQRLGLLYLKSG